MSEIEPAGWDLQSALCDDDDGTDPATIVLDPGETVTCVFTNKQRGKIIVDKVTDPAGSPESFEFVPSWGANFFLADATSPNDSGWLVAGGYSVSEIEPVGWDLQSASCNDDDGNDPATIVLDPGETVTCVFTNKQRGKIIVDKVTDPPGSGQSFEFVPDWDTNFFLTDGDTPYNSGWLVAGGYSVSEIVPGGWDLQSALCDDDDGTDPATIVLDPGETVTCVFTNKQRGKIIVDKVTDPAGSTQSFEFVPSWAANFFLTDGDAPYNSGWLVAGGYSVSEILPLGWGLQSAVCDDDDGSDPASIVLDPGETVTCIFTNQHFYLGYTPGFWKNHGPDAPSGHNAWQYTNWSYIDEFCDEDAFEDACDYFDLFDGMLLMEALRLRGGKGEEGAAQILARHATAALLNADLNEVQAPYIAEFGAYPYSTDQVVDLTNAAFATQDRQQMLDLANEFDMVNNSGSEYFDWNNWPLVPQAP